MEMVCGDISVYAEITMPTRQRGDVDNYTKALLDGLQGYAYENDKQVVELYARMELDKENPGIRTAIAPFSMDSVLWAVTHG
jgi:Holliday junction resolvase RusA-like endonuclease